MPLDLAPESQKENYCKIIQNTDKKQERINNQERINDCDTIKTEDNI